LLPRGKITSSDACHQSPFTGIFQNTEHSLSEKMHPETEPAHAKNRRIGGNAAQPGYFIKKILIFDKNKLFCE
jgi:hypothetical protein